MQYSLEGQEVSRICFDYAIVLETVDGTELRIESPFRVISPDGLQSTDVNPESLHGAGEAIVGLLHQQILLVAIEESGALALRFATGQLVECRPSEQFEAWTLVTSAGERIVCLPGGGVAHWSGSSPP